jgi:hypothetical protein
MPLYTLRPLSAARMPPPSARGELFCHPRHVVLTSKPSCALAPAAAVPTSSARASALIQTPASLASSGVGMTSSGVGIGNELKQTTGKSSQGRHQARWSGDEVGRLRAQSCLSSLEGQRRVSSSGRGCLACVCAGFVLANSKFSLAENAILQTNCSGDIGGSVQAAFASRLTQVYLQMSKKYTRQGYWSRFVLNPLLRVGTTEVE